MPKILFDANIFISRPDVDPPKGLYMSVVVLQELLVGAEDAAEVKLLNTARVEYERQGRLLVPNAEDWWLAGKVVNSLQRGLKSQQGGQTPKIIHAEKYRVTNDVMIARTAKRAGVTVVTDNEKDFERIRRFCAVRTISSKDYFGD